MVPKLNKLNLDVGSRTWRTKTAEAVYLERERRQLAEQRMQLEELSQRQMAEEELQRQLKEELFESGKQKMLEEADMRLQQLRDEVAALEAKHQAEIAHWEEREQRAATMEAKAEERARAREAAEVAEAENAAKRAAEQEIEREQALARLRQDALDEYRRAHEEIRAAQQEQLRREVEEARRKIAEESVARKAALDLEREETIRALRAEAEAEYRRHLEEQRRLDAERAEEMEKARAEAAREFKRQQQEALRKLYSAAGQRLIPSRGPIEPEQNPADMDPIESRRHLIQRRAEAARRAAMVGAGPGGPMGPYGMHPGMMRDDDFQGRRPPGIMGVSPASGWGLPTPRQRARSFNGGRTPGPTRTPGPAFGRTPAVNNLRAPMEGRHMDGTPMMTRGFGTRPIPVSAYPPSARPPNAYPPPGRPLMQNGLASARLPNAAFATPRAGFAGGWGAPPPELPGGRRPPAPGPQHGGLSPGREGPPIEEEMPPPQPRSGPTGGRGKTALVAGGCPPPAGARMSRPAVGAATPRQGPMSRQPSGRVGNGQRLPSAMAGGRREADLERFCVVTVDSVPGFHIHEILGDVSGVCLRQLPTSQPMTKEEQDGARQAALEARRRAVSSMIEQAHCYGANGVVGLKFESSAPHEGQAEIIAYGTAVLLQPARAGATAPNIEEATITAAENEVDPADETGAAEDYNEPAPEPEPSKKPAKKTGKAAREAAAKEAEEAEAKEAAAARTAALMDAAAKAASTKGNSWGSNSMDRPWGLNSSSNGWGARATTEKEDSSSNPWGAPPTMEKDDTTIPFGISEEEEVEDRLFKVPDTKGKKTKKKGPSPNEGLDEEKYEEKEKEEKDGIEEEELEEGEEGKKDGPAAPVLKGKAAKKAAKAAKKGR